VGLYANIFQLIVASSALLGPGWRALAPTLVDRRARAVGRVAYSAAPKAVTARACAADRSVALHFPTPLLP
jgi:hypothetical protein